MVRLCKKQKKNKQKKQALSEPHIYLTGFRSKWKSMLELATFIADQC